MEEFKRLNTEMMAKHGKTHNVKHIKRHRSIIKHSSV